MNPTAHEGFLLTHEWRDAPNGTVITLWAATANGPVVARVPTEPILFVERSAPTRRGRQKELALTTLEGRPVDGLYFGSQRDLVAERDRLRSAGVRTYESDLKPDARYLMERFVTGGVALRGEAIARDGFVEIVRAEVRAAEARPALRIASIDVETDGPDGSLLSIAATTGDESRVWVLAPVPESDTVVAVADEGALIDAFVAWTRERDPDVIVGWNVIEFDLATLVRRAEANGRALLLGRGGEPARVLLPETQSGVAIARVAGRVMMDGVATMRSATWSLESFSLDSVAREVLGEGKLVSDDEDRIEEIRRMFREDRAALARYNLHDAELALRIFERARLVEFAVERQRLTGLSMDRQGGSVASFDRLYLPRLHRHGHVAPDVEPVDEPTVSPGGFVLEPDPGLHDDVLVFDFKSLYPSIIRTFRIDPMGLAVPGDDPVPGFAGATFHRDRHILPGLIETLWAARDEAKRAKNGELSTAIKILMNSFYGVLGSPGCRFFDARLASSITRRGHEIITRTRDFIEARGHRVVYGDTDSLFVLAAPISGEDACRTLGKDLARATTDFWRDTLAREHRIESALEIQFETHYVKLFLPTLRGSTRGSKKRYAGWARKQGDLRVVIRGLEAVRTDWTPLARRFQRELFRRVFAGEPFEEWAREEVERLRRGELDAELVYRKRLRRPLDAYERGAPAHVQAARMLGSARTARAIEYVMTVRGPEPVRKRSAPIDHEHYVDKQLAPASEAILAHLGTSLARIAGRQMDLF